MTHLREISMASDNEYEFQVCRCLLGIFDL